MFLSTSNKRDTMLRLPVCGFAKRVDDTVARAMTILQNRENFTAKKPVPGGVPKPQDWRRDRRPK